MLLPNETRVYAKRNIFADKSVELSLIKYDRINSKKYYIHVHEWQEIDEGQIIPPTLGISDEEAQFLIDQLWAMGVRPSEMSIKLDTNSSLEAKYQDMKDIHDKVFTLLKEVVINKQMSSSQT